LKASLWCFVVLLLAWFGAFGQSAPTAGSEGRQAIQTDLLNHMKATIQSDEPQIDPWERRAWVLAILAALAAIFGLIIATIQHWSRQTWCRITSVALGVAVAGITGFSSLYPVGYKECFASVLGARAELAKMNGMVILLENSSEPEKQLNGLKARFEQYQSAIEGIINKLSGLDKGPSIEEATIYKRPEEPIPQLTARAQHYSSDPAFHTSPVSSSFRVDLFAANVSARAVFIPTQDVPRPRFVRVLWANAGSAEGNSASQFGPPPHRQQTPIPSPDTQQDAIEAQVQANSQCGNFSGTWQVTTNDLTPMPISQLGCRFDGNFDSPDHSFKHVIRGEVWATAATITVDRWDPSGCFTQLYGAVRIEGGILRWDITGSAGKCGLSSGFREHRDWLRR
jgi:hypothetical protein